MNNVLVSLVSEQTVPNVLFIREKKEEIGEDAIEYLFISTEEMERICKTDDINKGSHIENSGAITIRVVEDSIRDTESKLEEFAKEKLSDTDNIIVNLTCGTKIMSIAAYEFFKKWEKSTIYYLPKGKNIYKQISPSIINNEMRLNFRISLKDYLCSYGIKIENKDLKSLQKPKEYTESLFKRFIEDQIDSKVIDDLRKSRDDNRAKLDANMSNFIKNIQFETEKESYLKRNEICYLTGGWFEEYVYNLIRENIQLDDDKIGLNVHISRARTQNEFDVMFVHENTLYVIECKTGLREDQRDLMDDTLYKLSALRKDFGLTVRSYLFTLENLRNNNGKIRENYQDRADLLKIGLVDRAILTNKGELGMIFDSIRGGTKDV
jgi:hypothetical protein